MAQHGTGRPPESLSLQHQWESFDCGKAALICWISQRALANERHSESRSVVLCPDEDNNVIAYTCLSAGAFELFEVPGAFLPPGA